MQDGVDDDRDGNASYLMFCVYIWHRQYFRPCRNHNTLLTGAIRNWASLSQCRQNVKYSRSRSGRKKIVSVGLCVWLSVSSFHTSAFVCFKMDVVIILVKSQKRIEWYPAHSSEKKREINMMLLSCYSLRWNWLFIKWVAQNERQTHSVEAIFCVRKTLPDFELDRINVRTYCICTSRFRRQKCGDGSNQRNQVLFTKILRNLL